MIAFLKLVVILIVLLDCIVGQVNALIHYFILAEIVPIRTQSQISFLKEMDLHLMGNQHPNSDIKLPAVVQKRALHVLLDDK